MANVGMRLTPQMIADIKSGKMFQKAAISPQAAAAFKAARPDLAAQIDSVTAPAAQAAAAQTPAQAAAAIDSAASVAAAVAPSSPGFVQGAVDKFNSMTTAGKVGFGAVVAGGLYLLLGKKKRSQ